MKTAEKRHPMSEHEDAQARADIRTAYEIHTLAHMLYGQLTMPYTGMTFGSPIRGSDPLAGYRTQPWGPYAPVMWGYAPPWGV